MSPPRISKPGSIPHLHTSSPVCNRILRLTSNATSWHLTWQLSLFDHLLFQALFGIEPMPQCATYWRFSKSYGTWLFIDVSIRQTLMTLRSSEGQFTEFSRPVVVVVLVFTSPTHHQIVMFIILHLTQIKRYTSLVNTAKFYRSLFLYSPWKL